MSQERDDAIAPELRRLELMLLDPDVRRDSRQVEKLLAEDFLEFGSSGRIWTREPPWRRSPRKTTSHLRLRSLPVGS